VHSLTAHSFRSELIAGGRKYHYLNVAAVDRRLERLPKCLLILAANALENSPAAVGAFRVWLEGNENGAVVEFRPSRVIMHDTTCVPALVDVATLRDAVAQRGGDPARVNPAIPVDLVIDHSVMVDAQGSAVAHDFNLEQEFARNHERYQFIRWAEKSLANFRVVPPGAGIIHQINLEHLSEVVRVGTDGDRLVLRPETLVGTDSHTPMINALGILGWGVGGLEGISAALGEPLPLHIPEVVGVRLNGRLRPGVTATDLALTLTQLLRAHGVVDKFVEFHGPGVTALSVADRATIANMAPEYGATCSFFPVDQRTLDYLRMVGRSEEKIAIIDAYARAQGLWHDPASHACFSDGIEVDLGSVEPTLAGPKRPEDRLSLTQVRQSFLDILPELTAGVTAPRRVTTEPGGFEMRDGAVLIAAITSCTNTSNPALMIGAGLLARRARAAGLRVPPWVKTSLSPGSRVVTDYLHAAGLQGDLDTLGFQVTGYGCMTCIGNSGPLTAPVTALTSSGRIAGAAVLSGNRNFQGRINPEIGAAYLASPALVIAYALAGSVLTDLDREPLGHDASGEPVFLRQLWPTEGEIEKILSAVVTPAAFLAQAGRVFAGPPQWQGIEGNGSVTFGWSEDSTYLRRAPHFDLRTGFPENRIALSGARALLVLGDNVTTDHISPAGAIPRESLAGRYLGERGVPLSEFNQYSTRRGNHEVMLRGIFSNPRLRNELVPAGTPGGQARDFAGVIRPVYEAGESYRRAGIPLLIFAGKNYGAGSSRDWGAKGPALLGVRAVIAESFERIHRSNLIGMGILPLEFPPGVTRDQLALTGAENFDLSGPDGPIRPHQLVRLKVNRPDGRSQEIELRSCVATEREADYLRQGGLLNHLLSKYVPSPALSVPRS
jgi:aconitate hydratase